ncbi:MAG: elongation factor P maturation arginine rhamnosyltransferase EarP [Treponema sp.]
MQAKIDLTLLCKVVDNFGDIGTAYRLARALDEVCADPANNFPQIKLRIITDNLTAFAALFPPVNAHKPFQVVNGWEIYDWNADSLCLDAFQKNPPHIIIECFQCGRPDWLETLLFDIKVPRPVHIVMLDYLSAEDYAETFHKLDSLTRSARVTKINFMPGFTDKTGGLILDEGFMRGLEKAERKKLHRLTGEAAHIIEENCSQTGWTSAVCSPQPCSDTQTPSGTRRKYFDVLFFTYPADWKPVVKALAQFQRGKLRVLAAQGAGFLSFMNAYAECGSPFALKTLDFMPQTEWDALLCRARLLFIRGEDSLSRACLLGIPFVWHAYPQTEDYQLVKVRALLERMRPYFRAEDFCAVERCWLFINGEAGDIESAVKDFLSKYDDLRAGFSAFAVDLKKNGNLAFNLMTFITKKYILYEPL